MKFRGNGSIWDSTKQKTLIRFGKEKIIDVTDKYIIDRLLELGYLPEIDKVNVIDAEFTVIDDKVEEELIDLSKKELIAIIENDSNLKVKGYKKFNKEQLRKIIKGSD